MGDRLEQIAGVKSEEEKCKERTMPAGRGKIGMDILP
jgi:hypothetical protein